MSYALGAVLIAVIIAYEMERRADHRKMEVLQEHCDAECKWRQEAVGLLAMAKTDLSESQGQVRQLNAKVLQLLPARDRRGRYKKRSR